MRLFFGIGLTANAPQPWSFDRRRLMLPAAAAVIAIALERRSRDWGSGIALLCHSTQSPFVHPAIPQATFLVRPARRL